MTKYIFTAMANGLMYKWFDNADSPTNLLQLFLFTKQKREWLWVKNKCHKVHKGPKARKIGTKFRETDSAESEKPYEKKSF